MSYGDVSNSEDIMDSRDVIERMNDLTEVIEDEDSDPDDVEDAKTELAILQAVADEGIAEWEDGATLIRDSYFTQYAEQLADDLGIISGESWRWPICHIDWEAAADSLKQDYTSFDWDGVEYWARA